MPEPTVPVPVSLIYNALDAIRSGHDPALWPDVVQALDALLSQPTPTAERHHPACGALDEPCHCTERGDAAPPSIADMAPGTEFTAGWPHTGRPTHWVVLNDGVRCVEHGRGYYGTAWSLHDAPIDPSTIRDVTPPKEQQ